MKCRPKWRSWEVGVASNMQLLPKKLQAERVKRQTPLGRAAQTLDVHSFLGKILNTRQSWGAWGGQFALPAGVARPIVLCLSYSLLERKCMSLLIPVLYFRRMWCGLLISYMDSELSLPWFSETLDFWALIYRAVKTGTLGEGLNMFCEVDTFIPSPRVPGITVLASINKLTEFSPFLIQNG